MLQYMIVLNSHVIGIESHSYTLIRVKLPANRKDEKLGISLGLESNSAFIYSLATLFKLSHSMLFALRYCERLNSSHLHPLKYKFSMMPTLELLWVYTHENEKNLVIFFLPDVSSKTVFFKVFFSLYLVTY